ncbi:glutathione S-transferase N-terminal domain-containing protein [Alphaproteobacteria bacterium]|nr:glutathione S-transferase N-terminal domain-containing protein [Alphaproteobacteria bacterium]
MDTNRKYPILYSFRRCPYAMRARLAIKASGIIVEIREVELKNKPKEFLGVSPKATVPIVCISSKQIIEESLDIMEWALKINDPLKLLRYEKINRIEIHNILNKLENEFKQNLDRYKYSSKFDLPNPKLYRDKNLQTLNVFNKLLQNNKGICSSQLSLLDYAVFPFIRQFRNVNSVWFDSLELKFLQTWLYELIDSDEFSSIMKKYEIWNPNQKPIYTNFST